MRNLQTCVIEHDRISGTQWHTQCNLTGTQLHNCREARSEPVLLVYCISWCTVLLVVESGMCLLATRLQGVKNHNMSHVSLSSSVSSELLFLSNNSTNSSRFTSG